MSDSAPRSTRFHGRMPRDGQPCAVPGCTEPGEFRAPAAPPRQGDPHQGPPTWRWLCLDHVRAHNAGYNFFAGMTPEEIYEAQSPIPGWASETRAFRAAGSADLPPRWADFADPMDALGARFKQRMDQARREEAMTRDQRFTRDEHAALATLGLTGDADRAALRRRYTELLRKYHPDRNGGDRRHEKQLRAVVDAYQLLRNARHFAG